MADKVERIQLEVVRAGEAHEIDARDAALLEDVLSANGDDHLYDQIMRLAVHVDDDPLVIFGWQNVEEFVWAIKAAQAQAAAPGGEPLPPDPLGLPAAVDVQTFKVAVLEHLWIPGAPTRLDTTCLPCSLEQFAHVMGRLAMLNVDAWTRRIIADGVAAGDANPLPIAWVYSPRLRSNTLVSATEERPFSLWG